MKTKKIFKILFGVWLIDFVLTFVALNFFSGFVETSPVARFFFSYGLYGFGFFLIINFIGVLGMSFLLHELSYNKYNSKPKFTLFVGFLTFFLIQSYIIINNIYWLIT